LEKMSPFILSAAPPFRKPLRYSGRSRASRAYHDHACFGRSVVNAHATPLLRCRSLAGKSVINTRTNKETSFVCRGKIGFLCCFMRMIMV
jgi:hypothetical protein